MDHMMKSIDQALTVPLVGDELDFLPVDTRGPKRPQTTSRSRAKAIRHKKARRRAIAGRKQRLACRKGGA